MNDLQDFLIPVNIHGLNEDSGYNDGQLARYITVYDAEIPDLADVDIVLVGVTEYRGSGHFGEPVLAADVVRKQLYQLHY